MSFTKIVTAVFVLIVALGIGNAAEGPKLWIPVVQPVHGTEGDTYNLGVVLMKESTYPAALYMLRITKGTAELHGLLFSGSRTYEKKTGTYWYMYGTTSAGQVYHLQDADGVHSLVWGDLNRKTKTWTARTHVLQPLRERWACEGFIGYARREPASRHPQVPHGSRLPDHAQRGGATVEPFRTPDGCAHALPVGPSLEGLGDRSLEGRNGRT